MSRHGAKRVRSAGPQEPLRLSRELVALGIFAIMVVAGPLLFGAVDRLPQIVLLVLLGIGLLVQPPAIVPLSRWGNRLALAFVVLLLFKEFAPAAWFGPTFWRTTLTQQYGLELPFTHHPEPARALDALLAGAVGVIWFLWVRRLAAERQHRAILAWTLFAAGGIVAIVSFATRQPPESNAIYRGTILARFTLDWYGFGPFPNRNHTADFFAMAGVLGSGCIAWAAARKSWFLFASGIALLLLLVIALVTTQSRGGLIVFGAGLGIYLLLCLVKTRNRRTVGAALGAVGLIGAVVLIFGGEVFTRFKPHGASEISNLARLGLWHDAIGMWRDAPLLGHGLDSFGGVFPLYMKFELDNMSVMHPESSWLLWLAELGLLPVLIAVTALIVFLWRQMPALFTRQRSFFLHAGGFAAFAVVLIHAVVDVPAHRWGTAGFALAALALACPLRLGNRRWPEPRMAAIVPLAIAAFWCLPIFWFVPAWSPTTLNRVIELDARTPGLMQLGELEKALHYFPLEARLHQSAGLREVQLAGLDNRALWQRHFAIASRLLPRIWDVPMTQARACARVAPLQAVTYWQQAVERGASHSDEILMRGVRETGPFPAAQSAWGRYVEAHPQWLLAYAQLLPEAYQSYYYRRWWKLRADATDLTSAELEKFYTLTAHWGNREDFDEWAKHHAADGVRDYRQWATLLHGWGEDDHAWKMMSLKVIEPSFPMGPPTVPRGVLETTWRLTPGNSVNAQQLALARLRAGDQAGCDEIILAVAHGENAPPWFVDKAAWVLARAGRPGEAVDLLLQPR